MITTVGESTDLLIVGAGPTGLFGTFYAGLRQMTVRLIDSLEILGGQLTTLYPEKPIFDVPGYPSVLAKDLANRLIEQAMQTRPRLGLGEQVQRLTWLQDVKHFEIVTSNAIHKAKAVLIAGGVGAFQPKKLSLPNSDHLEGKGVFYAIHDPTKFADKNVLIVGGGDSAVDWANMLAPITNSQTLIHRRDRFRAHESAVSRMWQTPTQVLTFHELRSLRGDGKLSEAVIYDNRTGHEERLAIDAVLVNIGFVSSLGPIRDWGLELDKGAIRVNHMMQTSRVGVFAAGDICTYPGKLKLIATGFGEVTVAVNFAKQFLDPTANVFPGHSSNLDLKAVFPGTNG